MIVAYPSKAEGFGLPVLEAMACGSAVMTARRLSLPEVGGDAVEYTEPDVDGIATTLVALIDDPERRASAEPLGSGARPRVHLGVVGDRPPQDLRKGRRRGLGVTGADRGEFVTEAVVLVGGRAPGCDRSRSTRRSRCCRRPVCRSCSICWPGSATPASTTSCWRRPSGPTSSPEASATVPRSACASTSQRGPAARHRRRHPQRRAAARERALDPVVILNSDVLSSHDIAAQVDAHVAAGADVSLHLTDVEDARAFGCVPTDATGRVTAFLEKTPEPVTNAINAGCYVFTRRVIDDDPRRSPGLGGTGDVPRSAARRCARARLRRPGYWLDVGTPATFVRGACDLVLGRLPSSVLPGPTGESLVLPGARIADGAVLSRGTTVGAGAVVGAGARVDGSVLLDGAFIGDGAVVRDSVVGAGAFIGARTVLDGVTVGDRAYIGEDNELLAGARVWVDATLPDRSVRFSSDELSS